MAALVWDGEAKGRTVELTMPLNVEVNEIAPSMVNISLEGEGITLVDKATGRKINAPADMLASLVQKLDWRNSAEHAVRDVRDELLQRANQKFYYGAWRRFDPSKISAKAQLTDSQSLPIEVLSGVESAFFRNGVVVCDRALTNAELNAAGLHELRPASELEKMELLTQLMKACRSAGLDFNSFYEEYVSVDAPSLIDNPFFRSGDNYDQQGMARALEQKGFSGTLRECFQEHWDNQTTASGMAPA